MSKREYKIDNPKGADVTELRSKFRTDCETVHYSDYMFSGPQILAFAVDVMTELSERRDNGDGSLLAKTDANYHASLFAEETIEVIVWLEKEGSRSRTYGFEMYKLIEYHRIPDDKFKILDEPILVSDGTLVCVVKKPRD